MVLRLALFRVFFSFSLRFSLDLVSNFVFVPDFTSTSLDMPLYFIQGSNFLNVKWLNVQCKWEKSAYRTHAERDSIFKLFWSKHTPIKWRDESNDFLKCNTKRTSGSDDLKKCAISQWKSNVVVVGTWFHLIPKFTLIESNAQTNPKQRCPSEQWWKVFFSYLFTIENGRTKGFWMTWTWPSWRRKWHKSKTIVVKN